MNECLSANMRYQTGLIPHAPIHSAEVRRWSLAIGQRLQSFSEQLFLSFTQFFSGRFKQLLEHVTQIFSGRFKQLKHLNGIRSTSQGTDGKPMTYFWIQSLIVTLSWNLLSPRFQLTISDCHRLWQHSGIALGKLRSPQKVLATVLQKARQWFMIIPAM
jgi:hypothetical protein